MLDAAAVAAALWLPDLKQKREQTCQFLNIENPFSVLFQLIDIIIEQIRSVSEKYFLGIILKKKNNILYHLLFKEEKGHKTRLIMLTLAGRRQCTIFFSNNLIM